MLLDRWITSLLQPLACWVLINGLDDLVLNLLWLWTALFSRKIDEPPANMEERPVAIFVPLWREHRVIRHMVEHNIEAQKFGNFHIFIGAYPNDAPTLAALEDLEHRHERVHIAKCPHNGPTSKADCLNWVYQRMLLFEEQHGIRFETVVTHDAEDLIHPDALRLIDFNTRTYGMVQIPVLALPTPTREWTHGVYCDEFAQFQFRDMPVRNRVGGFVPSNGVGTGFSRQAIESIAAAHSNRIFEPACLTEDYENGFRVHRLGFKQLFIPLAKTEGYFAATREYFPRTYGAAVRQRTRWTTGIVLQSWEYHGWRESIAQFWWLWRDRKTLVNNLLTPLVQILAAYGLITLGVSSARHTYWNLGGIFTPLWNWALFANTALYIAIRTGSTAHVYGWKFAAAVPVRMVWGSWINFVSSVAAVRQYAAARWKKKPLVWLKTEHAYPNRATLLDRGEAMPPPDENTISTAATRSIPAEMSRRLKVLPFKVVAGHLHLAGVDQPTEAMHTELSGFSSFEIRFHRVSQEDYQALAEKYLPAVNDPLTEPAEELIKKSVPEK